MTTTRFCHTLLDAPGSVTLLGRWWAGPAQRRCVTVLLACAQGLGMAWPTHAQTPTNATSTVLVAAGETMNKRYGDAQQAYEDNHWPQAFATFLVLATEGHADAARVVMLMHRHGPRLYGQQFAMTASQWAVMTQLGNDSRGFTARHVP